MQPDYENLFKELEKLRTENSQLKIESQKNNFYSKIFENSPISMFVCNNDGFFVEVNDGFSNLTGYSKEELRDMNYKHITPKEYLEEEIEFMQKNILDGYNIINFEKKYITKNNKIVWVSLSITVLRDNNNKPEFYIGTCENITEKRFLEQNLKEINKKLTQTNNLLQAVLDGIPDIIGIQDANHNIIQYNKAGLDFFKVTQNQLIGKKCYELLGRIEQCEVCSTPAYVKSKKPERHEQYFPMLNIWVDMRSYPILDEKGEIVMVIEHLRDITEQKELQKQLAENNRLLNTLFSNLPGMAYRCFNNSTFDMLIVSDGALELTGYRPEQLVSNSPAFGDIIVEEDKKRIWDEVQKAVFKKERYELFYRIKTANNQIKYMWERAKGIFNENGELLYIEGFIWDISKRVEIENNLKEKEAQLKQQNEELHAINEELRQTNQQLHKAKTIAEENEKKYRLIFDTAPIGLFKYDEKGIILECNDNFVKIVGSSREKLVGLNMTLLPDKKIVSALNESFSGRIGYYNDIYQSTTAQKVTPVIVQFAPIKDNKNNVVGGVGIVQDITEIKNYEAQLKQQNEQLQAINEELYKIIQLLDEANEKAEQKEQQFRKLFENMQQGFALNKIIVDENNKPIDYEYIMVNDAFFEHTGKEKFSITGKTLKELYTDVDDLCIENFGRVAQTGEVLHFEEYSKEFDRYFDVVAYSPQKGYFAVIFTDITKNKKYEKQLLKAKAETTESEKLKTAFLHNISHEIRTPLNAICGFSEFLKDETLIPQKRAEFAEIIINSGYQLSSIIDDIVSISSIESGLAKPKYKKFSLNELLEEIYKIFLPKSQSKGIILKLNKPNLGVNEILSDKTKLSQIISNLISNALKFTEAGSIEIGYSLTENFIEFFVKDTGIGIDKGDYSKIFERFQQANSSISFNYGGTGLGLSIAKAYTELLGGKIWVESQLGQGSKFYFTIPYITDFEQIINYKALLVEDDKRTIEFFEKEFIKHKVSTIVVDNEIDALIKFEQRNDIDIVLFSLKNYNVKQYAVLRQIVQKNKYIPIIVLSAFVYEQEKKQLEEIGVKEYLQLPIDEEAIKNILKKYFIIG